MGEEKREKRVARKDGGETRGVRRGRERERGKRARAEERKRGAENEAGEGKERYVNVERQIE